FPVAGLVNSPILTTQHRTSPLSLPVFQFSTTPALHHSTTPLSPSPVRFSSPGAQRILRFLNFRRRSLPERLENFVDGAFELRVAAFGHHRRIVNHRDIRVHAVALDDPFPFGAINAEGRHRYAAAIH